MEHNGHIRSANEVRKHLMQLDPTCKPAYQDLWNSWVKHSKGRGVPKGEMKEFLNKFKQQFPEDFSTTESSLKK